MTSLAAPTTERPYGRLIERQGLPIATQLMLDEVPDDARVLDVGCATGYVGERLAARGCRLVGFERDVASAAGAAEKYERVIVGDFESPADRDRIAERFDVILMGDVLEHLVDPWDALAYSRSLLTSDGVVVASIPNVGAWPVRTAIARGSFDYADHGLMDRTHLRWFTRQTARELAHRAGFVIERERVAPIVGPPGWSSRMLPLATDVAKKAALRLWPGLMAQQFVMRLRAA